MTKSKQIVLVIDVGGTNVKIKVSDEAERRSAPSDPEMPARQMVDTVLELAQGWAFDVISVGLPAPVLHGKILRFAQNLGDGSVGFDFEAAFGRPVKVINDAAMQALGSYDDDRMLFLGLGAGLGSAMIVDGIIQPMELAHPPYKKGKTFEDYVGIRGLDRLERRKGVRRFWMSSSVSRRPWNPITWSSVGVMPGN